MEISQNGLDFIKGYEGCILHPYLDQGGVATIGWGMTYYPSTGKHVKMTDLPISQAEADSMFILMVKPYADGVIEACSGSNIPLNQNQLASLTSFAYNCGLGAFRQSKLCQNVILGKVTEADFTLYDHVNGQVSVGLLNRRKAEYQLFIKPIKIMEPTTPVTAEVTPTTPKTLIVKKIMVTFDLVQNGLTLTADNTEPVKVTPELLAALALEDATLIEGGYNISVVGE